MSAETGTAGRVEFYWWETKPGEESSAWWGQLRVGVHRLHVIIDELDSIRNEEDIDEALARLAYHMENYLVRVYEIRDRMLRLLQAVTGCSEGTLKKLRDPKKRAKATSASELSESSLLPPVVRLLEFLDNDILLRHEHTHSNYLSLGLFTGHNIFDPSDLLVNLGRDPDAYNRVKELLGSEIERLVEEYQEKVRSVAQMTMSVLNEADALLKQQK